MSTDYEDKEREFLAYLKADTGRDLAAWMDAIKEANLAHRNEIIDWLRQQGFIFAWASWLERIHHNGGRPIYLSEAPPSLVSPPRSAAGSRPAPPGSHPAPPARPPHQQARAAEPRPRPVLVYSAPQENPSTETPGPKTEPPPTPAPQLPTPAPQPTTSAPSPSRLREKPPAAPVAPAAHSAGSGTARALSPEVASIVAKAKAYAPLAGFILRNLSDALPGTNLQAMGNYIACNRPQTFAILLPGPKDVKLGLALTEAPFERHIVAARFSNLSPPPPKAITYMAVLTDARQVDAILVELLRSADAAING